MLSLFRRPGRDHRRTSRACNGPVSAQVESLEIRQLLSAITGFSPDEPPTAPQAGELIVNPGIEHSSRILVQFRPEFNAAEIRARGVPAGTSLGKEFGIAPGLHEVQLGEGVNVAQALAAFRARKDVLFAEPDFRVEALVTPNDPGMSSLWGLSKIQAPKAWDTSTGIPGTIVAVIDSGVDYTHPDLKANMWVNTGEIAGDRLDNDGNGYVDDVHGYDFAYGDGNPMDDQGHGTHVAGTIGAVGNNGMGVVGVNWSTRIMALKFLDSSGGGYTSSAIKAIDYAVANGAKISNNSWGGGGYSQSLYTAIQNARNAGHVFIAAAGNEGRNNDSTPSYPASYDLDNIISVAATDRYDRLASFSNYGAKSVDLAAPGVDIVSTVPGGYAYMSGTSMAAPHVSGVVALVWGQNPGWSYKQVIDRVLTTGDSVSSLATTTATGKRLNAAAALTTANRAPVAGDDTASVLEDSSVKIAVLANDSDPDGNALTPVLVSGPSNGQVTLNSDRTFTYTPKRNFNGSDSFKYKVNDGTTDSNTATVSITVAAVNDAPNAADDVSSTTAGTPVTITVLANDTDVDGDGLSVSSVAQAGRGSVVINGDGTVTYTPNAGFAGTDSFTYTIDDGRGGSDAATVTVTVSETTTSALDFNFNQHTLDSYGLTPDGKANDLKGTVTIEDGGATLRIVGNRWKKIDFPYTVTADTVLEFDFQSGARGEIHGIGFDTDLTYSPELTFQLYGKQSWGIEDYQYSSAPGVQHFRVPVGQFYTGAFQHLFFVMDHDVSTPTGESVFSNVRIYEDTSNDPPIAADDTASTAVETAVTISVLANDTDPDGDPVSVSSVTQGTGGTVAINAHGTVTYTPNAGFTGTDSFTYTIGDGNGGTDTATVTVGVSDASSALDFSQYTIDPYGLTPDGKANDLKGTVTIEDGGATLRIVGNRWKKIDFPYTVTADTVLEFDFQSGARGEIHGIGFDSDLTYSPELTFQLYGSQSWGLKGHQYTSAPGVQHFRIPVGQFYTGAFQHLFFVMDHDVSTPTGESVFSNVRIYEDTDGDGLSVSSVTQGSHGSLAVNADGAITHTPDGGSSGTDSFTYTAGDGTADAPSDSASGEMDGLDEALEFLDLGRPGKALRDWPAPAVPLEQLTAMLSDEVIGADGSEELPVRSLDELFSGYANAELSSSGRGRPVAGLAPDLDSALSPSLDLHGSVQS